MTSVYDLVREILNPTTFENCVAKVVNTEGVLSTDRNDHGNWTGGKVGVGEFKGTKYGISAAAYPKLDIANLTKEEAIALYRKDYWELSGCHLLDPALVYMVFDTAVNSGVSAAKKLLQAAAGLEGKDVDGIIGPKSMAAIKAMHPYQLLCHYAAERIHLMRGSRNWEKNREGWITRVMLILAGA